MGCADFYNTFTYKLKIIFFRIHGSNKHIGNHPANQRIIFDKTDLKILEKELNCVIKKEDFEKAAIFRDRIKDLEADLNRM